MNGKNRWFGLITIGVILFSLAGSVLAQEEGPGGPPPDASGPPPDGFPNSSGPGMGPGDGGGPGMNFDPAAAQQQLLKRYRQLLELTNADEWSVVQPLLQKVLEAQMAARTEMGPGMPGMFGPPPGGPNGPGNSRSNSASSNQQSGQRRGPFGPRSPEAEALQKVISAKAAKAEVAAALDTYVSSRQAKQDALRQAQENLRKLLTSRQEAIATLNGLL